MRYVPIEFVPEDSFLAQPLLNEKGMVLLSRGAKLTPGIVEKIKKAGFYSVYILDNISDEEIEDIVKPEVRRKAVTSVKKLICSIAVNEPPSRDRLKAIKGSVDEITDLMKNVVDDVFNQKDLVMNLIDIKNMDDYTYSHSVNVMLHALVLGISTGLNKNQLYDLALGSVLHDVGKVFVPHGVLKKPSQLSVDEFKMIKEHTVRGFNFLKEHTSLGATARIVSLQHQERVDGTGYPMNLKDPDIHMYAKITAVADVYDALTSDRHYRRALPAKEALEYIMGSGGRLFNMDLVKAFVLKVNPYPPGTLVKLSNGAMGVVERSNKDMYLRPIVKILREQGREVSPWLCDLFKEKTIVIQDIVYTLD